MFDLSHLFVGAGCFIFGLLAGLRLAPRAKQSPTLVRGGGGSMDDTNRPDGPVNAA